MRLLTPQRTAAIFLLLAAALPMGSWLILLIVGRPEPSIVTGGLAQLEYTFSSQNPDRGWFLWWTILPVLLIALAYAYSTNLGTTRTGSIVLLGLVGALLVVNAFLAPSVAALLLMPLLCGVHICRSVRRDA